MLFWNKLIEYKEIPEKIPEFPEIWHKSPEIPELSKWLGIAISSRHRHCLWTQLNEKMSIETLANITLYATTMLWRRSTMVMSGRQIGYRLPILSRYAEWDDLTIRLLECLFTITIHSFQHYSYVTANYMYVNYVMFRYPYTWCSRVFQSCLFHPWNFGPVFSGPAISTHAILSHVFQSRVFHSRVFSRCISCDSPWSNFLVSLTTRAAAFNTRCSLSVVVFGAAARIALQ